MYANLQIQEKRKIYMCIQINSRWYGGHICGGVVPVLVSSIYPAGVQHDSAHLFHSFVMAAHGDPLRPE